LRNETLAVPVIEVIEKFATQRRFPDLFPLAFRGRGYFLAFRRNHSMASLTLDGLEMIA
jgi:hypothetical protein